MVKSLKLKELKMEEILIFFVTFSESTNSESV